ncbi:hypothetical protein HK102_000368 [Quaeritorhiza haematococci]|nr:hypothetical protein HK102_000368 [Quaeritorhiza haematococci]
MEGHLSALLRLRGQSQFQLGKKLALEALSTSQVFASESSTSPFNPDSQPNTSSTAAADGTLAKEEGVDANDNTPAGGDKKETQKRKIPTVALKTRREVYVEAGEKLAAVIVAGVVGSVGEIPLDRLADITHEMLLSTNSSTTTLVPTKIIYAFLLAGKNPTEATEAITEAITHVSNRKEKQTPPSSSDSQDAVNVPRATLLSLLHSMRGYLHGLALSTSDALQDFAKALALDSGLTRPLFLRGQVVLSVLRSSSGGNVPKIEGVGEGVVGLATMAIEDLTRFVAEEAGQEEGGGGEKEGDVGGDPALAHAYFLLLEAWFRRGPRNGIRLAQLLTEMEELFGKGVDEERKVAEELGVQGEGEGKAEMGILRETRERAEMMLQKVRGLARRTG